jgi:6-pyruvoyltetrahydropterin/6-carboxytetrahydropterin synthase
VPFEITITRDFSASHQLKLYDGSLEPLHGHNWHVVLTVASEKLDSMGVVMDFHELQRLLDQIIKPMHNAHLNDLPMFKAKNPSAENVAVHIGEMVKLPTNARLAEVEVWETPDCRARWRPPR